MIELTKLDGQSFYLSPHQLETMEENPDTVLHLLSGRKIIVQEDARTVLDRIIDYRRSIGSQDVPINKLETSEGS